MKMPETIRVGVCDCDNNNLDPREIKDYGRGRYLKVDDPDQTGDGCGEGFMGEYRFVRLVEVTETTPAPIIEVKEVTQ